MAYIGLTSLHKLIADFITFFYFVNFFRDPKSILIGNEFMDEFASAKKALKRDYLLSQIVGKSKVARELLEKIEMISLYSVNVLITGETGTGKELAARAIHYLSPRAAKPFIPINCGAIPESLFENEIFGHVRGAFTNAFFHQRGLVTEAEGGTLFLDEIETITPFIQVKLLRFLENKEYKPIGDSHIYKSDIRIIAGTNRDLLGLVRKGIYREDLFYRLSVVPLHIPPLRERKEDIRILVEHFVKKYAKEYSRPVKTFSEDFIEALLCYDWPGNIRELENKIQQLIIVSTSDVITAKCIQLPINELGDNETQLGHLKTAKKEAINNFEKTFLVRLLTEHMGNVVIAAKSSGKSRTALWNLLKKHNISPNQFRADTIQTKNRF